MSTEAKAIHDVSVAAARGTTEQQNYSYDSNKAKLMADLKTVVADAEKLIKEAAGSSSESFAALRTRFEGKLCDAKASLGRARTAVGDRARNTADTTHAYVKANPWQTAGVCAAAGLICGFLLGYRAAAPASDVND